MSYTLAIHFIHLLPSIFVLIFLIWLYSSSLSPILILNFYPHLSSSPFFYLCRVSVFTYLHFPNLTSLFYWLKLYFQQVFISPLYPFIQYPIFNPNHTDQHSPITFLIFLTAFYLVLFSIPISPLQPPLLCICYLSSILFFNHPLSFIIFSFIFFFTLC